MNVDRLQGLLEFGAYPFVLEKQNFLDFGVIAKKRHHQTTGPLPSAFTQLMCADMLHGLLELGADPFVLDKQSFLVSAFLERGAITTRRVHCQAHSRS